MRKNKNLKTRILYLVLTLTFVVTALPMTVFAVSQQSNMYITTNGTATPAGNDEDAITYEYTTNPLWASSNNSPYPLFYGGTYDDITFEAVFTTISGVNDYGTMEFSQTGFIYTPSAEVGGKTVSFKLQATENETTVKNDATWSIIVADTPVSGSSDATLSTLTYSIDGDDAIALSDFDADTDSYTVWLSYGTETGGTITLAGTVSDTTASVSEYVNATTDTSPQNATITVTAENGSTKTYTVTFEIEDPEVDPWVYFDGTYYGSEVDGTAVYLTDDSTNKIFAVCHGYGGEGSSYSVKYFYGDDRNTGSSFSYDYYNYTYTYEAVYLPSGTELVTVELYSTYFISSSYLTDIWEIDVYWLTYSASDDTITVTCTNTDKPDNYPTDGYDITIVEPEATECGSAGSFEATIINEAVDIIDTDDIAITYKKDDTTLDSAPTAAGTYTASITVEGKTASVEYTIAQASSSVAITSISSTTYENDITITATVSGLNGENPTGTVTFYNDETEIGTATVADGVATYTMASPVVDKYSITAKFTATDGGNYKDSETESATTFDITKASQTIEITAVTGKEYNDADFTLSITGQKDSGNVTYSVPDDNGVVGITGDTVTIIGAGTVTITATVAGNANYNGDSVTYDLIIAQDQAPGITFPVSSGLTYGDTLADSTLVGDSAYGTFAWTDNTIIPTASNDGYEVTFTPSADTVKNYEAIEITTMIVDVTVDAKEVTVVIDDIEIVRGMDIPTLTGTVDGDIISDVVVPTYSVLADNSVAGEYTITMINASDYANYDIIVTTGTLTITEGYTVTIDGVETTDVAYGTVLTQPETPTRDDYIFLGWFIGETEFDFTSAIVQDIEIVSMWEEVVEQEFESTGNAEVTIDAETEAQLLDELFTDEEIAMNVEMKVAVNVDIVVVEDMDETAQEEFNSYLEDYNASVEDGEEAIQAVIFDISVIRTLAGVESTVTNLETPITITISIPEEYQSADREFFILRNHEGTITILEDLDDDPTTITFTTDCFSNYTLNYIEKVDIDVEEDADVEEDDKNKEDDKDKEDVDVEEDEEIVSVPDTGDNNNVLFLWIMAVISFIGTIIIIKKRLSINK